MFKAAGKIATLLSCLAFPSLVCAAAPNLVQKSWDDVVAQSKKEGSVTFNVWYLQPQWRDFVKTFEKEYGIKVRIPEGTMDGNLSKLLAEASRSNGKIDVVAMSINQLPIAMDAGALMSVSWLPGYDDAFHVLQNVDSKGYGVAFWGNQTGFAYDPMRIDAAQLPQTMEQLQDWVAANPKKFGYNDPNNGGAGEAFIQRVTTLVGGNFDATAPQTDPATIKNWDKAWQWFLSRKELLTQTASGADSLTRLNDGELVLVPAWEDHLAGLQKTGALTSRIKFYIPALGMPGGGNIAAIAANSPNPAASAVFLNWLIQADTQKELNRVFGSVPMHKKTRDAISDSDTSNPVLFYGKEYSTQLKKEFVRNVVIQ